MSTAVRGRAGALAGSIAKWKEKAQLCVLSKIGSEKGSREKVRWAPVVARNGGYGREGAVVSLENVYKKKSQELLSATKGKRERPRIEQNWTGLALGRWWLGCGLANGAETAVMTPVSAGIGLQRQNINRHPDAAVFCCLWNSGRQAAGFSHSQVYCAKCEY